MKKTLFLLLLLLTACQHKDTLFESLSSGETGITFANRLEESPDFNVLKYGYFYNGGGVAAGDFNNDGLVDLYFTGNLTANKLYLNKGEFRFEDITDKAGVAAADGWNTGVSLVDINADGWLDIYVCRSAATNAKLRRNLLFINNKNLTFSEKAAEYGLDDPGYSSQAAFVDYDRDGDLDCFLLNHSVQEFAGFSRMIADYKKQANPDYASKLYQNQNGHFVDVSAAAGLVSNVLSFGLGVAVSDFNNDGWPDLYVSNDYNENDYLYLNQQNGGLASPPVRSGMPDHGAPAFREAVRDAMGHTSLYSMGSDAADVNNDGRMDLLTLDMLPARNERIKLTAGDDNYDKYEQLLRAGFHHQTMRNMVQLNMGNEGQRPVFAEIGQLAGVSNTDWSWAGLFADFDNDGWKDLFVTNGYARDYTNMDFLKFTMDAQIKARETGKPADEMAVIAQMPAIAEPNQIFRGGASLHFDNKTTDWGFDVPTQSNGAVYADLDNDGDLDLVINNVNTEAGVYRNQASKLSGNQHLVIELKAKNPAQLMGARVTVWAGGKLQVQEFQPVRGFQSSMYGPLLFGLGKASPGTSVAGTPVAGTPAQVDSVQVRWADGKAQTVSKPTGNRLTIAYAPTVEKTSTAPLTPFFQLINVPGLAHREDAVNDFKIQPLLPYMLSETGPRFAVGDINGDKLADVFMGGGRGQGGQVFVQKAGKLVPLSQPALLADASFEDAGAEWFDADNDRDLDLIVASAGYELAPDDARLAPRLYLNNGSGTLTKATFPALRISASCVRVADVDQDGDQDVFIGARAVPGRYPELPTSHLLLNDGKGHFGDVPGLQPTLAKLGLVTDAAFADLNRDNRPDLLVATDFGPIQAFSYKNGQLQRIDNQLSTVTGCWNRLLVQDFDKDGDVDIVAANAGQNSQFRASPDMPLALYGIDNTASGALLPVLVSNQEGQAYPFNARDEMLDQVVSLRKKFTDYTSYANATITDLFTTNELTKTPKLTATELRTVLFRNDGSTTFTPIPLPAEAQFAPAFALATTDVNADGLPDLLIGGNRTHNRVRIGKADANIGQLFVNQGRGRFRYVPMAQSGLFWTGDVRDLVTLPLDSKTTLLVGAMGQPVRAFAR